MAFKLSKGVGNGDVPLEYFVASGAIAEGMPVALAAGTSGADKGKVVQLSGGANATELLYGIAAHAAVDTAEVTIIPALAGLVWEADAVANTNVTSVAADNYLTATTCTITVGTSTNQGCKCVILGKKGAAADKIYLVRFKNTLGV
jgi:hypothetical protein